MRIGFGYDVHKLTAGRRLILGGVPIDFPKGLLGHSDADVDSSIVCEAPRLGRYIPEMTEITATALGCAVEKVNIKATTEEGLGFTGRGEGISAYAVALLTEKVD